MTQSLCGVSRVNHDSIGVYAYDEWNDRHDDDAYDDDMQQVFVTHTTSSSCHSYSLKTIILIGREGHFSS